MFCSVHIRTYLVFIALKFKGLGSWCLGPITAQGSVEIYLRCGGIYNNRPQIVQSVSVKEF